MRRQDRRIESDEAIWEIIRQANVLYLAMNDGDRPYVLPLSYGYDAGAIYIHSAAKGRKLDIIATAPHVCFAISIDQELVRGERSCDWGFRYRSVIGEGTVSFVVDEAEKRRGLDALMHHYGGQGGEYSQAALANTTVLRIDITYLSGKQAGFD